MIETSYLILRPIQQSDFDRLYDMYRNPIVMQSIDDGSILSREETLRRVEKDISQWAKYGFGGFMLIEKSTQLVTGYCGLRYSENANPNLNGGIELGFMLDKPFWGKGFATEAVRVCIEIGFNKHCFKKIFASILSENIASQKVVTKAGMQHTQDVMKNQLMYRIYEIQSEN